MEDSDGVPQAVIEKGRDLWWGLILLVPRVVLGSEAQLGHSSQDCAGLTPGAVRSSHWIFRLGCWLHEESVLLRENGISSRDQWREALGIGLSTGARGLGITVLFLFNYFDIGNFLLLVDLLLLQAGLIFLNSADLLLQHPTILNEVFELCDGSFHCIEESLQSVQPLFHLPTRRCISEYLHGL